MCVCLPYQERRQFTEWPDKGVPQHGRAVLRLLQTIKNMTPPGAPVVLHCSAGIGRTGTIIAIDIAVQRLTKGKDVDVRRR